MSAEPYQMAWEESYKRLENTLFYPAEEVVRFVNRYIRRRTGVQSYSKHFQERPAFLDVGSGAGRHLVFLWENGFFPIGIELSEIACGQAKEFLEWRGAKNDEFSICNGSATEIELAPNSIDYAMSVSTLDSMPTQTAIETVAAIRTVLKQGGLFFADMLAPDQHRAGELNHDDDQIIAEDLEKGTVQSYYSLEKISRVFGNYEVVRLEKISKHNQDGMLLNARWHGVFRKL